MNQSWLLSLLLLVCSQALAQDVVYLRRDQVLPYLMGQQIGNAANQVLDARTYTAERQTAYVKLESLRNELEKCGNCAERATLESQVKTLRSNLFREDGKLCGAIDSAAFSNPAVAPVTKLMGFEAMCAQYNKEADVVTHDTKLTHYKAEFDRRVKAGDIVAYGTMGRNMMSSSQHLPFEKQADLACPYWAEGMRKGDRLSKSEFEALCGQWAKKKSVSATPRQ